MSPASRVIDARTTFTIFVPVIPSIRIRFFFSGLVSRRRHGM